MPTASTTTTIPGIDDGEALVISKIDDPQLYEEVVSILDGDVTVEDLSSIIDGGGLESLDDGVLAVISDALSDAPNDVKEEFEDQVDVFSGSFDNYVPVDSKISVAQRRSVIAVTAAITTTTAIAGGAGGGTVSRRKSSPK